MSVVRQLPHDFFIRALERDGKVVDFHYWNGSEWAPLRVTHSPDQGFIWETPKDWQRGGEVEVEP